MRCVESVETTNKFAFLEVPYNKSLLGELILIGDTQPQIALGAWLESPKHCAIIISPQMQEVGIARVGDYRGVDFGSRIEME